MQTATPTSVEQVHHLVATLTDAVTQRGSWRTDGTLRAAWAISRDCHTDPRAARCELRRGELLQQLSSLRAAVVAGRLAIEYVDLVSVYATPARFELLLLHEAALVEQLCAVQVFADAERIMRYWADQADEVLHQHAPLPPASRLRCSRSSRTGELRLSGLLDAVDAEVVDNELRRLMAEIRADDRRNGVQRGPQQLRAAALVRMATRSPNAEGRTARPSLQVVLGAPAFQRVCELASGVVLTPEQVVGLVDTAFVEGFLFDGNSTVVATSRRRTFIGALRRALQLRDLRCQHGSGCPTRFPACDIDHIEPAAWGGPTSQFNGRVACAAHNRLSDVPRDHPVPRTERTLDRSDELRALVRWRTGLHP